MWLNEERLKLFSKVNYLAVFQDLKLNWSVNIELRVKKTASTVRPPEFGCWIAKYYDHRNILNEAPRKLWAF